MFASQFYPDLSEKCAISSGYWTNMAKSIDGMVIGIALVSLEFQMTIIKNPNRKPLPM